MRAFICFLAFGFGGTAFAQSTPTSAPHGAPAANRAGDRLDRVDQVASEALFRAQEALTRLSIAEAEIDALQRSARMRTGTPAPAPAPTAPTTTSTSPTPTTPPVVPPTPEGLTDGQFALAQIRELKMELGGLIVPILAGFDEGAGDRLLLALADAGPTGLLGRVDQIETDVAALKTWKEWAEPIILEVEARPVVFVETGIGALALFAAPKFDLGLDGTVNVAGTEGFGEIFARVGGASATRFGGLELSIGRDFAGGDRGTHLCGSAFAGPVAGNVRGGFEVGFCDTQYRDTANLGWGALQRDGIVAGLNVEYVLGEVASVRCRAGGEFGNVRVFKGTARQGGSSTSGYAGCGLAFGELIELDRRDRD